MCTLISIYFISLRVIKANGNTKIEFPEWHPETREHIEYKDREANISDQMNRVVNQCNRLIPHWIRKDWIPKKHKQGTASCCWCD
jgi:hypothetical protein